MLDIFDGLGQVIVGIIFGVCDFGFFEQYDVDFFCFGDWMVMYVFGNNIKFVGVKDDWVLVFDFDFQ